MQTLEGALDISKVVSDDLLPTWTSRAACPILDLAVSSIALAVFSRTQQHPLAATEASLKYNQLLRVAQTTIPSLDGGNIDACLLAVFLMSRYENVVYRPYHSAPKFPFVSILPSFSHHDGTLAILETWKSHLSRSQPATDVIKHSRRAMIKSALLRNIALPEWILEGSLFGEQGLELQYYCIVVRIAGVRQRFSTLLRGTTNLHHTSHKLGFAAEELNKEAQSINKSLEDWAALFPSTWCFQRHTLPSPHPWPTEDFYSPTVYSYLSPAYAAVWCHYYAMRMLIISTRLTILKFSLLNSHDFAYKHRLECLSHMKDMADDLASSVPFCFQRVKVIDSPDPSSYENLITIHTDEDIKPYVATLIGWPLTIASSLRDVDEKQRLWFRSQLARLGRILGDGVLEHGEASQWFKI